MKLLFITPKIDERHDDLAFASLWARAFQDAGFEVEVICTAKGESTLPFPVHSLGGENGASRYVQFLRFQKLIMSLKYDRVFVHMTPRWHASGSWYWWMKRIPTYLWYTHYTNTPSLRISVLTVKRMFAATKECLPQYDNDPRKIVTGHGIDTKFWESRTLDDSAREPKMHLLAVHRISRSKRLDIAIRALALLPPEYTLTHYGRPQDPRIDPTYQKEIEDLVVQLGLQNRVVFKGAVPMSELPNIYPKYRVFVNMVPQTIDKTVLEAMYCGLTPVIIKGHADAIGYPDAPSNESPEAVAEFIRNMQIKSSDELRAIVSTRHSLKGLVEKMSAYIREGN